jgi:hypothetical protein
MILPVTRRPEPFPVSKHPPKRSRHLHIFFISLVLIVATLGVFLFGVKMEDTAAGKGIITSARVLDVRASKAGRIELDPNMALAPGSTIISGVREGETVTQKTAIATIDQTPVLLDPAPSGAAEVPTRHWEVIEVLVRPGQQVAPGDVIARLVEVNPASLSILEPLVRLDVEEKYFGELAPGQEVRLYSNMYHHRVHGVARGKVERLEPAGEPGPNGARIFHAWVAITESPFPLKLGASVRAEVIVGRKPTYQIILEH